MTVRYWRNSVRAGLGIEIRSYQSLTDYKRSLCIPPVVPNLRL